MTKSCLTLICAALLPLGVSAQTVTPPPGAEPNAPTPEARTAPATGESAFKTFVPTSFEQKLFQDRTRITLTDGEGVYKALCAGCHMPDHQGATGAGSYPALADNENLLVGDYIAHVVINGKKGMPAFGDILDDDQIVAVATYLQQGMADPVPLTVEAVKATRDAAGPKPE